jgi:hypothetical protein
MRSQPNLVNEIAAIEKAGLYGVLRDLLDAISELPIENIRKEADSYTVIRHLALIAQKKEGQTLVLDGSISLGKYVIVLITIKGKKRHTTVHFYKRLVQRFIDEGTDRIYLLAFGALGIERLREICRILDKELPGFRRIRNRADYETNFANARGSTGWECLCRSVPVSVIGITNDAHASQIKS